MVSYMDFLITQFWQTLLSNQFQQPNFTDLQRLAESIVRVHYHKKMDENHNDYKKYFEKEHKRLLERLNLVNEKLNEKTNLPLAIVEFMVFKNWHKSPDYAISIKGKSVKMYRLFNDMNEIIRELKDMVSDIAMHYSLDITYGNDMFGGTKKDEGANKGLNLGKKM